MWSNVNSKLLKAIKQKDRGEVRKHLTNGANPSTFDDEGTPVLHTAIQVCDLEIVELLLGRGAFVDAVGPSRLTSLMLAVKLGRSSVAQLLIQRGACIHYADSDGLTILMDATLRCPADLIQDLLSRGASLDARDKDGQTALMKVASWERVDVLRMLLGSGANPEVADLFGRTAVFYAATNCQYEALVVLHESGASLAVTDGEGQNCLSVLLAKLRRRTRDEGDRDYLRILDYLLAKGPAASGTALRFVVLSSPPDLDLLDDLIQHGASLPLFDSEGESLLGEVVMGSQLGALAYLLSKGVDPNAVSAKGLRWSALHIAVLKDSEEMVELLLRNGASPNFRDLNGDTPLMTSLMVRLEKKKIYRFQECGDLDGPRMSVVRMLLVNGARADISNVNGEDVFTVASQIGNKGLIELIRTRATAP